MEEKKNDLFTIGIIAVIILLFSVINILWQTGLISPAGMDAPDPGPVCTMRNLFSGKYFEDCDAYSAANFFNKTKWSKLVRKSEIFLGKKEFHGILLGKKQTYFENWSENGLRDAAVEDSLSFLEKIVRDYHAKVMLIPMADEIWKDRLPAYAENFEQTEYLNNVKNLVGEENCIDLLQTLKDHKEEAIYYRTEPYWTSLGAYYGYYCWWEKSGTLLPYYYDLSRKVILTNRLVGSLAKRAEMEDDGEEMFILGETEGKRVSVRYDDRVEMEGYYRPEYLGSQNPCAYFLGDGFGLARIQTENQRKHVLIVIGDLNGNVMIPFLASHYSTIYVLNLNYYQGDVWEFLEEQKGERTDCLVLQGVPNFVKLFDLKE